MSNNTNLTATQVALNILSNMPPEQAIKSELLVTLLLIEKVEPVLGMIGSAIMADQAASAARAATRLENETASSTLERMDAEARHKHLRQVEAIELEERKLRLSRSQAEHDEMLRRAQTAHEDIIRRHKNGSGHENPRG